MAIATASEVSSRALNNQSASSAPVFVGFLPKRTSAADRSFLPASVAEVSSVSNCISSPPDDWIERWVHNDFGFYDTEDLAFSVIAIVERAAFDLYAYRIFPVEVADDTHSLSVRPAPGDVPTDYEMLGYDIVSRSMSAYFECSPLSCNSAANEFRTNKHCLISGLSDAYAALVKIGRSEEGYEPGPYYLFEVYRKRR